MKASRLEGFWWARRPGDTWEVGEVYNYPDFIRGASGAHGWLRLRSGRYMLAADGSADAIAFGPYVGREPAKVEGEVDGG